MLVALILSAVPNPTPGQAATESPATEPRLPLAVLYAGDPEHARARDWLAFLRENFARADVIRLDLLSADAAREFDVVVCDWRPRFPKQAEGSAEKPVQSSSSRAWLPAGFSRPVVAIGAVGGELGPRANFDWL